MLSDTTTQENNACTRAEMTRAHILSVVVGPSHQARDVSSGGERKNADTRITRERHICLGFLFFLLVDDMGLFFPAAERENK